MHRQSANDHVLLGFNPMAAAYALITTSFDSEGDPSAKASRALHAESWSGQVWLHNIRRANCDFSGWLTRKKTGHVLVRTPAAVGRQNPSDFRDRNRLCQEV